MGGRGRRWATFMFTMTIIMSGIKFLFAFAYKDVGGHIAQALMLLVGGIILLVVPAYIIGVLIDKLKKDNTNFVPESESSKQFVTRKTSDDFYAQAWDEINDSSMTPDKSLWAKSYADAQGNESLAKANYIKLRVETLSKENAQKLSNEIGREGKFIAYKNGTVLNTETKLMWKAEDNGCDMYWWQAQYYCKECEIGNYKDWRLPRASELASLFSKNQITTLIKLSRKDNKITEYFLWNDGVEAFHYDSGSINYSNVNLARVLPVRSIK